MTELATPAAQPDARLTKRCEEPTLLPDRRLGPAEVSRYWSIDRSNLRLCGKRHELLTEFYHDRDEALAGK